MVCPPKKRGDVFTTAAVDNTDHNCSSTTSTVSFYGTGNSLLGRRTCPGLHTIQVTSLLEETSYAQVHLLSLLDESTHTVAMVKHPMDVVRMAVQHLNVGKHRLINPSTPFPGRSSGRGERCMEKTCSLWCLAACISRRLLRGP